MLHIGAYLSSGRQFADLTPMRGVKIRSNRRGYAQLAGFYPCDELEAYMFYEPPHLLDVRAHWQGLKIWEGRLEDAMAEAAGGGVKINALGHWRALYDAPYTALWSSTRYDAWEVMSPTADIGFLPDRYELDHNQRLYVAPVKNSTLGTSGAIVKAGGHAFVAPHNAAQKIRAITFTYSLMAASPWTAVLSRYTFTPGGAWTRLSNVWTLEGNGSLQTGTTTQTFSECDAVVLWLLYNSADAVFGGETGSTYFACTNVRVQGTTSASVYADEIARALVGHISTLNPAKLSTDTSAIESPGLDLRDEVYEDLWPGDILTRLAGLGDNQTPPRRWEVAVWENKRLRFQPLGSDELVWYVDVPDHVLERTMESMANSAYAVYQEPGGRVLRTAVADDADAQARYDLIRRAPIKAQTTSSAQAGVIRDTFLNDRKDPVPRARIPFDRVYNQGGGEYPPFVVLPGHTLVLRSLSPVAVTASDRVRSFVVDSTEYDVDSGWMTATPEIPPPGLETLLARRAAGVGV